MFLHGGILPLPLVMMPLRSASLLFCRSALARFCLFIATLPAIRAVAVAADAFRSEGGFPGRRIGFCRNAKQTGSGKNDSAQHRRPNFLSIHSLCCFSLTKINRAAIPCALVAVLECVPYRKCHEVPVEIPRRINILVSGGRILMVAVIAPKRLSRPVVCNVVVKSAVRLVPA
jgi:hypothetical protein